MLSREKLVHKQGQFVGGVSVEALKVFSGSGFDALLDLVQIIQRVDASSFRCPIARRLLPLNDLGHGAILIEEPDLPLGEERPQKTG